MTKVHTTKQAREWFILNHSGSVICVNKAGKEKECASYPEAEAYFDEDLSPEEKYIKSLVKADSIAASENHEEYPELSLEECCPHSSAEAVYIGDGDTEYTCRHCGYNWVSHNPEFDI